MSLSTQHGNEDVPVALALEGARPKAKKFMAKLENKIGTHWSHDLVYKKLSKSPREKQMLAKKKMRNHMHAHGNHGRQSSQ